MPVTPTFAIIMRIEHTATITGNGVPAVHAPGFSMNATSH